MTIGVVLVASALAGLVLVEAVIRRTDVGAFVTLALLLVLETHLLSLDMSVGSLRVGPSDLLVAVLLTAATARLLRTERVTTAQWLLLAFGVLVAWAIARGVGTFGLAPTINEARKFLVFLATALYFSTADLRGDLLHRVGRAWLVVACGLCLLTVLRWTTDIAGLTGGAYEGGGSLRVIPAAGALFVAQGAIIAFPWIADRSRPILRLLSPSLLVFVILLQHRTVWVISGAGVLYLLFRERALAGKVLTALALVVVLFAGLIFTVFAEEDDAVADQLTRSAQSTATFEWRMEGWTALITQGGPDGVLEVFVGQPFGTGWSRTMPNGNVVDLSPHSFYVEPYLRVGLLGLGALLLAYGVALRSTRDDRRIQRTGVDAAPTLLSPTILHTLIAVQLLFSVTYTPNADQALLLGLGLAVAGSALMIDRRAPTASEVAA